MTPWLLCMAMLALPPQHPAPAKTEPKAETKQEAKTEAKTAPAAHTTAQPVDAAARILERLNREFPYKTPATSSPETRGATAASKKPTRGTPKNGVPESRRSSRLTLSWRITLTWPAMQ